MDEMEHSGNGYTSLILTLCVLATLLLGLLSAQLDQLQSVTLLPTAPDGGNPVALINGATSTPRPTQILPQPSSTPLVSATPTPLAAPVSDVFAQLAPCNQQPLGWEPYRLETADSLALLAVRHEESVEAIATANCLTTFAPLFADQLVYLPPRCGPPIWWVTYLVERGDTLGSIARRVGSSVPQLMQANCLENDRIRAFTNLYVPRLPAPLPIPNTPTPTASATPLPSSMPQPSPTPRPTETAVPSATPPGTPTLPPTPTIPLVTPATPTPPVIPTGTPTITNTPTATPTPGSTATAVSTVTPTALPSKTATPTQTAVPTSTQTPTPTTTFTPLPTATSTNTPEPTPTATETAVPTSTPTNTPEPAATPTPTPDN